MPTEGYTRSFDAFAIALSQACEGGEKRWYTSTTELQLGSLDICRACRSTPTLHVRVTGGTPTSLWSPPTVQALPNTQSSKVRVVSRVPVVRALRLTWAFSMETLVQRAAIELWSRSERLEMVGPLCAASLGSVVWPLGLTQLVLDTDFHIPMEKRGRSG
ncbi:expressed unknown protein [Ectocarpus siliculosus]|uniref:Uncharacterized protein n=1 Tax=Ectocarpus siliculosus TaxID=2880 RepID=D7G7F9_ECTSI|nr:expressed unknown protein [Ectocarpus siliculosus]|eukprot:CBJ27701.1 expressed unknown protein [Ectocarpus siliculosus]